ncbi:MAG TPA: DUF5522 domain-containing protein [Terriglobales bacterium]
MEFLLIPRRRRNHPMSPPKQPPTPPDRSMSNEAPNAPLVEGVDYYIENGLWVFTAEYLKKRGYCCKSGCRHCPYGFKRDGQPDSNC